MKKPKDEVYQLGQLVTARMERVFPFGVFARLPDGTEAYLRKRELTQAGNLDPREVVSEGESLPAMVIGLAEPGRHLEISVRRAEPDPWDTNLRASKLRDPIIATIKNLSAGGAFVQVVPGVDGFIPLHELAPWPVEQPGDLLWIGDQVEAMIIHLERRSKRLRLSIRQQMIHMARVHRITGHLRQDSEPTEPAPEPGHSDEPPTEDRSTSELQGLGSALVLDDHPGVRREMVIWLRRHGCQVDGVEDPNEGLEYARQQQYGLAVVDIDLAGQDGLQFIRDLREISPDIPVIVMSIPEWIAERSEELEALEVLEVFDKPLDMEAVLETLGQLTRGEEIGPFRVNGLAETEAPADPFRQLAETMRSGASLPERFQAALAELVQTSGAELGVLFRMDPASRQVTVEAQDGILRLNDEAVHALTASPVKDLIVEGGQVFEARLTARSRPRFERLLEVVRFAACLGVPVSAAGRVEHALFLFHRRAEAFGRYHLRDAQVTAALLGVALESQALEERIETIGPFLLKGQLAAGFGHDVFNKMSALELQARNLRAACGTLAGQAAGPEGPGSAGNPVRQTISAEWATAEAGIDRLLQTTLDLKRTVEAFRELIRAEDQVTMDVNSVVQWAAELLQALARRHRVQIAFDLASDLPGVVGSPMRLQQTFLNVMLNAVQQMTAKLERWPEGWGQLRVTTGLEPGAGRPVWVRFADSGPGIHRRLWDSIFALGFSTRQEGTGLGLFIARSLVESMGGAIFVEQSLIPAGTTFRLELPAVSHDTSLERNQRP